MEVKKLEPPQEQSTAAAPYWNWLYRLWFRATKPNQILIDQLSAEGGTANQLIKVNAGTSAFEFASLGATAPIVGTFGTGTINLSHGTSGVVTRTYGGTAGYPQFAVNTTGHVTSGTTIGIAALAPLGIANGTSTMTWTHGTSGVAAGTYGGTLAYPTVVVNATGHATFGTSASIAAQAPITVTYGTGTTTWGHAMSGVVSGTYGNATRVS